MAVIQNGEQTSKVGERSLCFMTPLDRVPSSNLQNRPMRQIGWLQRAPNERSFSYFQHWTEKDLQFNVPWIYMQCLRAMVNSEASSMYH